MTQDRLGRMIYKKTINWGKDNSVFLGQNVINAEMHGHFNACMST